MNWLGSNDASFGRALPGLGFEKVKTKSQAAGGRDQKVKA